MPGLQTASYAVSKLLSARNTARHDYADVFLKSKKEVSEVGGVEIPKAAILILGCGYNYPDVVLWSKAARLAVGVDVRKAFWRNGFWILNQDYRSQRDSRMKSLAKTIVTRGSYLSYYDHMRRVSGLDLDEHSQDLVVYDGEVLPFADETFDIVCSNAVLEHVAELSIVSRETRRVAKPSGICYHIWHNYYSLSGAHLPDSIAINSPWGHLLGDPQVEEWLRFSGTQLNRMPPQEIANILSQDFAEVRRYQLDRNHNRKGLDSDFEFEGEHLLTPELEGRLTQYTREALLTRAYSFLGLRR